MHFKCRMLTDTEMDTNDRLPEMLQVPKTQVQVRVPEVQVQVQVLRSQVQVQVQVLQTKKSSTIRVLKHSYGQISWLNVSKTNRHRMSYSFKQK